MRIYGSARRMNWQKKSRSGKRQSYHHGNLREALVDAALRLIAEKGATGFTFAEAARAAGVSPAAPYRHFADRDALIAEIALRGYKLFQQQLERAWNNGDPDPTTAFKAVGRAYLDFARSEPALYTAMFESGVAYNATAELQRASDAAFETLRTATEAVISTLPKEERPPVARMNYHIWALSHGIADLFARGDGNRRRLPMEPEDLLEAAALIYLKGLGAKDP